MMDANYTLRSLRNMHLKDSDWTQFVDSPLTDSKKAEWATYRQALRDLPSTVEPKSDENENLLYVNCPVKPS